MKQVLHFSFSLLLISTLSFTCIAQEASDSTIRVNNQSGLELSFDYGKLFTFAADFESKWSGGVGYRYKNKVMLSLIAGVATLDPQNAYENGTYHAEGQFGSASLNYIITIKPGNYLYFGSGYGVSMYEDSYSYIIGNSIWPTATETQSRKDLQANWAFINIGSEKKLKINGLFLGGVFSIRKLLDYDEFEPVDTYAIPGYGRTSDSTVPALNIYIKYLF
ncbi:MAG: DUF6048 family protein [Fulvivirga sp.]